MYAQSTIYGGCVKSWQSGTIFLRQDKFIENCQYANMLDLHKELLLGQHRIMLMQIRSQGALNQAVRVFLSAKIRFANANTI